MRFYQPTSPLFAALSYISFTQGHAGHHATKTWLEESGSCNATNTTIDLTWHAPVNSSINNLQTVINGTGIYGFIFNTSQGPPNTYNWCNMPHVNPATYPRVEDKSYKLEYVEVIHRHHKRTPYAANTFPKESYPWDCNDEGLFYGGKPINPSGNASADTYWDVYTSPSNPFAPEGFNGTCQFPQITRGGLDDSHQHGVDLKAVYADLLHFLPQEYNKNLISYRVTNNVITSQVASMLIAGMYPSRASTSTPLLIQPDSIDSLEPTYPCPYASNLFSTYGSGSTNPTWLAHLNAATPLYTRLDALSGISPTAKPWHMSFDHYFDNLSARLCHQKSLPCNLTNTTTTNCVTPTEAYEVFRLGEYEYSFIYRDTPASLPASVGSYGIWIAELAQNLRHAMGEGPSSTTTTTTTTTNGTSDRVKYRHNVAHDGSISRLLAILQLEKMVWPGMGAEVVFELYSKAGCHYLRVLWGGEVMVSSHPALGRLDMLPVREVLAYFDGLVGVGGSKVPGICAQS
ncbi:hypothetical protein B0A50_08342 [Salinomyces thailandicus]|uniref:Acid phosphatase n=1 Tax=Salinomyces thailandicus TaxID=706561 RepID=A0A4U0TKD9_9PEZI|nr:hypothetical protein B0A50_08342 [Salinomyces thailandica]